MRTLTTNMSAAVCKAFVANKAKEFGCLVLSKRGSSCGISFITYNFVKDGESIGSLTRFVKTNDVHGYRLSF